MGVDIALFSPFGVAMDINWYVDVIVWVTVVVAVDMIVTVVSGGTAAFLLDIIFFTAEALVF